MLLLLDLDVHVKVVQAPQGAAAAAPVDKAGATELSNHLAQAGKDADMHTASSPQKRQRSSKAITATGQKAAKQRRHSAKGARDLATEPDAAQEAGPSGSGRPQGEHAEALAMVAFPDRVEHALTANAALAQHLRRLKNEVHSAHFHLAPHK